MTLLISLAYAILFAILPPCETEDSHNCRWDATTMGNGGGTSFVSILVPDGADGMVLTLMADGTMRVWPR